MIDLKEQILNYIVYNYRDNNAIGIDEIVKYVNPNTISNKINHGEVYKLLVQLRIEGKIHIIKKNSIEQVLNSNGSNEEFSRIQIYVIPV